MRRLSYAILLGLTALLLVLPGRAEVWDAAREIHCRENRPGCRLLQMVMMGSFDGEALEDSVSARVLASAYPRLLEITEEDILHFSGEFGEDGDAVRLRWYGALASCLRAEIAQTANPAPARRVLALFLEPAESESAEAERAQIRREMTEAVLERVAQDVDAPKDFVRWVIYGESP